MSRFRLPRYRQAIRELLSTGLNSREIAFGIAVGNFVGIMPLVGLHTVAGIAVAHVLRLNQMVVFLGAQISNPFTFPFIMVLSAQVGSLLLSGSFLEIKTEDVDIIRHYLVPLLLGSVVLGLSVGGVSYALALRFIRRFRS
jgi:uncharacterized protein (DUF2062 family)